GRPRPAVHCSQHMPAFCLGHRKLLVTKSSQATNQRLRLRVSRPGDGAGRVRGGLVKLRSTALSLPLVAAVALASPAAAQNIFDDTTSTEDGYQTYDADQIDIENQSRTGDGVYVAVLDTGLLPYWSEYFPEERVATHLGAGFYQKLTFKPSASDPCEAVET